MKKYTDAELIAQIRDEIEKHEATNARILVAFNTNINLRAEIKRMKAELLELGVPELEKMLILEKADIIKEIKALIDAFELWEIDDSEGLDVRLQVTEIGNREFYHWFFHYGYPCYDTNHRGFWGASSIDRDSDANEVAEDLISQVEDSYFQSV